MFDINILNTECVNTENKIQNMEIEGNIKIKVTRVFKHLTSIFTNSGKRKKDILNRIEQVRKATRTLNTYFGIKYYNNGRKQTFNTVADSIVRYGYEICTVDHRLTL